MPRGKVFLLSTSCLRVNCLFQCLLEKFSQCLSHFPKTPLSYHPTPHQVPSISCGEKAQTWKTLFKCSRAYESFSSLPTLYTTLFYTIFIPLKHINAKLCRWGSSWVNWLSLDDDGIKPPTCDVASVSQLKWVWWIKDLMGGSIVSQKIKRKNCVFSSNTLWWNRWGNCCGRCEKKESQITALWLLSHPLLHAINLGVSQGIWQQFSYMSYEYFNLREGNMETLENDSIIRGENNRHI